MCETVYVPVTVNVNVWPRIKTKATQETKETKETQETTKIQLNPINANASKPRKLPNSPIHVQDTNITRTSSTSTTTMSTSRYYGGVDSLTRNLPNLRFLQCFFFFFFL